MFLDVGFKSCIQVPNSMFKLPSSVSRSSSDSSDDEGDKNTSSVDKFLETGKVVSADQLEANRHKIKLQKRANLSEQPLKAVGKIVVKGDRDKILERLKRKKLENATLVDELMRKSVIQAGFEKISVLPKILGKKAEKRARKAARGRTKGKEWFDLPATELTEERKKDLEVVKMRNSLDPKRFYRNKREDGELPKYYQIGTVLDSPLDFYSSRVSKKERKQTIVDELLADEELLRRNRQKYKELKSAEAVTKKGSFRHKFKRKGN